MRIKKSYVYLLYQNETITKNTNIMTKEEKIKEAWGEYYEKIKNELDEHGRYSHYDDILVKRRAKRWQFKNLDIHNIENSWLLIPSSIIGIENNNGWIKIESEDDLPTEIGIYRVKDRFRENVYKQSFNEELKKAWIEVCTHYQPIEEKKPPIY